MSSAFLASYIMLWVLVCVLLIGVFALYHHFGQMYLDSREGRETQGPGEGADFPPLQVDDINGTPHVLPPMSRPSLVLFASTSCSICAKLRTDLVRLADTYPDISVFVLCAGHPRMVRAWAGELATTRAVAIVPDPRSRIAVRYRVGALPFCIAVGRDGVVRGRGIVNEYDGLELAAHEAASASPFLELKQAERSP